jgi:hypothetical protein
MSREQQFHPDFVARPLDLAEQLAALRQFEAESRKTDVLLNQPPIGATITLDEAVRHARRGFDEAEAEIQSDREREAAWRDYVHSDGPGRTSEQFFEDSIELLAERAAAERRRRDLADVAIGVVFVLVLAILALLHFAPGGTP